MDSVQTKSAILDKDAAKRKIRRMALEVAEQNTGENNLVVAGITGNGTVLAKCIAAELQKIVPASISLATIELDKADPREVVIQPSLHLQGKVVIVVDDVANTGKTMFYALKPFLQTFPKKLQTMVLVERSHKMFPIQTDYAGLTLATTLQEHIAVETDGEEINGAWLY